MKAKVIKFTSFAVALFSFVMTFYTVFIGLRLSYCSTNIIEAREYFSIEYSNSVYYEMNDMRKEIADENEYANMICHMNNGMRFVVVIFEGATTVVSYVLFWLICEYERAVRIRKRKLATRRRQMSRG